MEQFWENRPIKPKTESRSSSSSVDGFVIHTSYYGIMGIWVCISNDCCAGHACLILLGMMMEWSDLCCTRDRFGSAG